MCITVCVDQPQCFSSKMIHKVGFEWAIPGSSSGLPESLGEF
jgi:hypothetical protein